MWEHFKNDPTFAAKVNKAVDEDMRAKRKKRPQNAIDRVLQEFKAMRVAMRAADPIPAAGATVGGENRAGEEGGAGGRGDTSLPPDARGALAEAGPRAGGGGACWGGGGAESV